MPLEEITLDGIINDLLKKEFNQSQLQKILALVLLNISRRLKIIEKKLGLSERGSTMG